MNKIILIMSAVMTLLFTGVCSAMTISQPTHIGTVVGVNIGGFRFKDELSNFSQGPLNRKKAHTKGIATFGTNAQKLYLHYQTYNYDNNRSNQISRYGSSSPDNAIQIETMYNTISMMTTDSDITLYAIRTDYDLPGEEDYTLIGERQDGRFVKYLSTDSILQQYYGSKYIGNEYGPDIPFVYLVKNITATNDTVIFYYYRFDFKKRNEQAVPVGEIRCKWDENAQWFAVENVVY